MVIVVVFGPSGAGKTQYCRKAFRAHEVVSPDRWRVKGAPYRHDGTKNPIARCYAEAHRRLATRPRRVGLDIAATDAPHLDRWQRLAGEHGAALEWVGLTTATWETLTRNVHSTPPEKLRWMWESMEETLETWDRPGHLEVIVTG